MIVGKGDIASVLNDREGAIFFASGVSNSMCDSDKAFRKEFDMLMGFRGDKRSLFYFSSIGLFFPPLSKYFWHKKTMEHAVRTCFKNHNIIRIGNITWGSNPNTFMNYIRDKKAKGEPVEIRDEWKYLISKDELLLMTDNLPLTGKNEISVFGKCKKVIDCL